MSLLDETLAAHGGLERWREIDRIRLRLRCGGLAMPMKGRPDAMRELHATIDTRRPRVEFAELGIFDGTDPRPAGMSRRLRWSDEDVIHFAGYALWNYMTTPFLFTHAGVATEELPARRLRVTYPGGLPTHCRQQVFHIGEDGLVKRVDYTADVFGPWARAANRCLTFQEVDGLVFATSRRVTPRGLPSAAPALVSIQIDEIDLA